MSLKGNIKKSFTKTFAELTIYYQHHLIRKTKTPWQKAETNETERKNK